MLVRVCSTLFACRFQLGYENARAGASLFLETFSLVLCLLVRVALSGSTLRVVSILADDMIKACTVMMVQVLVSALGPWGKRVIFGML